MNRGIADMASVAVRLSSSYQGKGYGTEALSAMTKFCFENNEKNNCYLFICDSSNDHSAYCCIYI